MVLPPGFEAHKDPHSGRTLYENNATLATQWDMPMPSTRPPGNPEENPASMNRICACASPLSDDALPPRATLVTRTVTRCPVLVAGLILAFLVGFIYGVGIPDFQAGFNGYDARSSVEALVFDGFKIAQSQAMDFMRGAGAAEDKVTGQKFEPLTQEEGSYRTIFFFHSVSGDIMSQDNLASVMKVLNGVTDVLTKDFCYKGAAGGDACKPPFTLMDILKTYESGKLRDMTKAIFKNQVLGLAPALLKQFVGTDTDFEKGTASWMQGHVLMGAPLRGYHNKSHDEDKQQKERNKMFQTKGLLGPEPLRGGWITKFDEIIAREEKANPDFEVYYGGKLFFPRIFGYVNIDIQYAVVSLLLVAVFMWVQLGSVFLTFTGMFSVVISFVLALPTWKLMGNGTFTFMQAMVVYIILGIGADNVFVFADAWKQSRAQPPNVSASLEMRFQWSWSRSMSAMSVTSLTTAIAFVLTSFSDVPVISTFGTFAAIAVSWGWVLVVTWFPACVLIHERYVVQSYEGFCARRCCGCLLPICGAQWGLVGGGGEDEVGEREEDGMEKTRVDTSKLRGPERFFRDQWHPLLMRRPVRLGVILVFTIMAIVGTVLAALNVRVTKKPTTEAILKKSHPLQKTFDLLRGVDPAFRQPDSSRKELGYWAYGLDPTMPIDRTGTNPLSNGPNGDEISFEKGWGVARYVTPVVSPAPGMDLNSEVFQRKLVADCEKMEKLPSVFRRADGKGEVYCFMHDFKTYLEFNGRRFPVPRETLVDEMQAWVRNATCRGLGCYRNKQGTGVTQGREDSGLYARATGFNAQGKTVTFAYIGANLTMPLNNLDMSFIVPEYQEMRDSAVKENIANQASGVEAVGLTGRTMWIGTMNALVRGVIEAIPTSIGVSFLVLAVTTGNWKVAAWATVTIVGVIGSFFITFVGLEQTLGVYESMFLSLTAGFAVDYVVHFAHAYNEAEANDKCEKMQDSLTTMGVSVLSGAVSVAILKSTLHIILTF
jgi:protein dispatched 1